MKKKKKRDTVEEGAEEIPKLRQFQSRSGLKAEGILRQFHPQGHEEALEISLQMGHDVDPETKQGVDLNEAVVTILLAHLSLHPERIRQLHPLDPSLRLDLAPGKSQWQWFKQMQPWKQRLNDVSKMQRMEIWMV